MLGAPAMLAPRVSCAMGEDKTVLVQLDEKRWVWQGPSGRKRCEYKHSKHSRHSIGMRWSEETIFFLNVCGLVHID